MAEEVKPDVIKKTQDSLKKHIKKPPLTEKLLKKPPFRFLHDIITSVIRDTGFLEGLFTEEELNHENIKDRDGKIAFLDKLISAVKIITGIPLSVRATKIVAGHEATKTNELLQAVGLALDKKLDSKDVAQQLRKKGAKLSNTTDTKKTSPRDQKGEKIDAGKSKSIDKTSKKSDEAIDKKKLMSTSKPAKEMPSQEESTEKKKRSSSVSKQIKTKDSSKSSKQKKETEPLDPVMDSTKEPEREQFSAKFNTEEVLLPKQEPSDLPSPEAEQKRPQSAKAQRRPSTIRQQAEHKSQQPSSEGQSVAGIGKIKVENKEPAPENGNEASLSSMLPPLLPELPKKTEPTEPGPPQPTKASSHIPSASHAQSQPQAPAPVPLARPRTAARVGSARPGAPRVRNKGEAIVVSEESAKLAPVHLIVEDESTKVTNEDEDENLVVVESIPVDGISESYQPSAPAISRPSSQQGHLVAQILETQKELEVGKVISENGETLQYHTEIEWEAGKKRERETAMKEVDRMRSLIQSLTRAAHPLGKLLDSLQEDVDNMQRELSQWQSMQQSLGQQLQMEETLSLKASQPLTEQLEHIQQAIHSQLDHISAAKSSIFSNEDRIRRLLSGSYT